MATAENEANHPADDSFNSRWMRGWAAPMGVFAACALMFMLSAWLGGFWITPAQVALIVVGVPVCLYSMARSVRNIWRCGIIGCTRPRWWFEAGSIVWTLTVLDLSLFLSAFALGRNPPVWLLGPLEVASRLLKFLFPAVVAIPLVGYALSLLYRRKPRGKAHACVSFFFGITVIIMMAFLVVPQGAFVEQIALGFLGLAVGAGLLAAVIAAGQWIRRRTKALP